MRSSNNFIILLHNYINLMTSTSTSSKPKSFLWETKENNKKAMECQKKP